MSHARALRDTLKDKSGAAPGVLFVGPYPPPYGGISSHLRDIAGRFSMRGIRCCVLSWAARTDSDVQLNSCLRAHRVRTTLSAVGARRLMSHLFRNPTLLAFLGTLGFRRFLSAANRALVINEHAVRCRSGVVSIYGTREGDVIPFLRAANPELRVAFTFFADPIKRESTYKKEARFWRRAFSDADYLASSSRYCASAVERMFPGSRPKVIYVGVEIDKFSPSIKPAGSSGERLSVLFFGRMERDMGVDDALSIADLVIRANPDVDFVIAGANGELTPHVQEVAAASGGRITAKVNVESDAVPSMFAAADLLIAPTVGRHACMGVSVKEAMASGVPAVVSNSGGLPEAISDGAEGFVVSLLGEKNDIARFADAVLKLCNDARLRKVMGGRAREKAEVEFSNVVTEERVRQLLRLP
jgi:glycosyltransferase involved in cell wall biosynthesis